MVYADPTWWEKESNKTRLLTTKKTTHKLTKLVRALCSHSNRLGVFMERVFAAATGRKVSPLSTIIYTVPLCTVTRNVVRTFRHGLLSGLVGTVGYTSIRKKK